MLVSQCNVAVIQGAVGTVLLVVVVVIFGQVTTNCCQQDAKIISLVFNL